jgi:hypothetical protein
MWRTKVGKKLYLSVIVYVFVQLSYSMADCKITGRRLWLKGSHIYLAEHGYQYLLKHLQQRGFTVYLSLQQVKNGILILDLGRDGSVKLTKGSSQREFNIPQNYQKPIARARAVLTFVDLFLEMDRQEQIQAEAQHKASQSTKHLDSNAIQPQNHHQKSPSKTTIKNRKQAKAKLKTPSITMRIRRKPSTQRALPPSSKPSIIGDLQRNPNQKMGDDTSQTKREQGQAKQLVAQKEPADLTVKRVGSEKSSEAQRSLGYWFGVELGGSLGLQDSKGIPVGVSLHAVGGKGIWSVRLEGAFHHFIGMPDAAVNLLRPGVLVAVCLLQRDIQLHVESGITVELLWVSSLDYSAFRPRMGVIIAGRAEYDLATNWTLFTRLGLMFFTGHYQFELQGQPLWDSSIWRLELIVGVRFGSIARP